MGGILPGLGEGTVGGEVAGEASNVVQVAELAVLDVLCGRSGGIERCRMRLMCAYLLDGVVLLRGGGLHLGVLAAGDLDDHVVGALSEGGKRM